MKPIYLGDSVYASFDGFMVRVYTDNGLGPENEIFLEPDVMQALIDFAKKAYTDEGRRDEP